MQRQLKREATDLDFEFVLKKQEVGQLEHLCRQCQLFRLLLWAAGLGSGRRLLNVETSITFQTESYWMLDACKLSMWRNDRVPFLRWW